jgi:signal transduction histidine kinase
MTGRPFGRRSGSRERVDPLPRFRGIWRVWLLTAVLVLLASGVYLGAIRDLRPIAAPLRISWWALAAAFLIAEVLVVHVQFRRDAFSFSLSEVPLVIGLFFAHPVDLIAAQVVGAAVALVLHRRQPPVKVSFNLAHLALETGAALVVFHGIVGAGDTMGPAGWVGAVVAALVAAGIADVAVWMAISLADRRWQSHLLFEGFVFGKVTAVANATVGLAAAVILWREPMAAWVLLVPLVTVFVAYRAYTDQRRKHQSLENLYESGRALQRSMRLDATVSALLKRAREMFRAEIASITFFSHEERPNASRTTVGPGDLMTTEDDLVLSPTEGVWARVASEGRAVLLPRPIDNDRLRDHFAARGIRDAMVGAIHVEDSVVGVLEVANRMGDISTFDEEDLKLFETLAGNGSLAIQNARLVERLEDSLDRLTEMNRVKDDFVATVSHELRTPLTIIQGFIKTLISNDPTFDAAERRRLLEAADRGAWRLRELIEQLLMVSRLESDTTSLQLQPVSVPEVVADVVREMEGRRDGHTIDVQVPSDLPPVLSDRPKLHRILSSVVDNALKHTRAESTVTVTASREGTAVAVSVCDEGPGIPASHHERIFERFFQVDSSTTRPAGGTGLGLYIARRLAEELGAKLWLERSDEQGSEFRISVPSGAGTGSFPGRRAAAAG